MKIVFLQAGGTIDKDYSVAKSTYDFHIGEPAFKEIISIVRPVFETEFLSILKKDSMDMNDADRELVLKKCKRIKNDKIIITHGTDTMIDTAKKLSEIKDKTIVITGSAYPYKFKNSDANFNLGVAVGAITILEKGIYIAMNGRIYTWDKCKKHEDGKFFEK